MNLARLFKTSIFLLTMLFAVLLGNRTLKDWDRYIAARDGIQTMQVAYKAMVAAEKVSFERGPTIRVIGDGIPADPVKQERLAKARAESDRTLAELIAALQQSGRGVDVPTLEAAQQAKAILFDARQDVDRLRALPKESRESDQIIMAMRHMFTAIQPLFKVVNTLSRNAEVLYPERADVLYSARLSVELREYAGRIGSELTAALAKQRPLNEVEIGDINVLRGRIQQLRELIEVSAIKQSSDIRVSKAVQTMEENYFAKGLPIISRIEQSSSMHEPYELDTAQFIDRYVPHMASIVWMRDRLVEIALETAHDTHRQAKHGLILSCALGACVLLILAFFLFVLNRRVLRPILYVTQALNEISDSDLRVESNHVSRRDEVSKMLHAVELVRAYSAEMLQRESDRDAVEHEIKKMAFYDNLTKLPNRRLLEERLAEEIIRAERHNLKLALLFVDVDKFKPVNDEFGHETGDWLLQCAAERMQQSLRTSDTVARLGGDEFVVLLSDVNDADGVMAVAEKLRTALSQAFVKDDGIHLHVSCSIGIAMYPDQASNAKDLLRLSDMAMYRAKNDGRNTVCVAGHGTDSV